LSLTVHSKGKSNITMVFLDFEKPLRNALTNNWRKFKQVGEARSDFDVTPNIRELEKKNTNNSKRKYIPTFDRMAKSSALQTS
jgi:hypothetical protein